MNRRRQGPDRTAWLDTHNLGRMVTWYFGSECLIIQAWEPHLWHILACGEPNWSWKTHRGMAWGALSACQGMCGYFYSSLYTNLGMVNWSVLPGATIKHMASPAGTRWRLVFYWQTGKEAYNICIETILKMFLIFLYHAQGIIPLKETTLSKWSLSKQEINIKGVQRARNRKVIYKHS